MTKGARHFSYVITTSLAFAAALFIVHNAHAAPLNYSSAQTISIASPTTTFTIATGSVADALTVNATSVLVTLSSSTGGGFTLLSASYNFAIASSSGGGSVATSCTSGVASTTIVQSTGQSIYTIAPLGTQCSASSTPPSPTPAPTPEPPSVSVPAGYGANYNTGTTYAGTSTAPAATTTTTTTTTAPIGALGTATTTEALRAQLNSLIALLNTLIAKATAQGIAIPPSIGSQHRFDFSLRLGMSGSDVTSLQQFLAENTNIYPEGLATGYFGTLTLHAVERFQVKYGIANAGEGGYGLVGPKTRAKLNALIAAGQTP